MPIPERRQTPRATLEKLAYLQIEPDNGGIVLNVSPNGLCFHSIAPVAKDGPLRFSLLEHNHRIAACGELTWTDEIQKIGGIRFTTLPAEAREQVQEWITTPAAPVEEHTSTLGPAILKAFPKLRLFRFDANRDAAESAVFAHPFPRVRLPIKLSGFARGLATGLLLSAICASVALMFAHRRDIGESLIHLGQGLAGERVAAEQPAAGPSAAKPILEKRAAPVTPPTTIRRKPNPSQKPAEALALSISTPSASPVRSQVPPARSTKVFSPPPVNSPRPQSLTPPPQVSAGALPHQASNPPAQPATGATSAASVPPPVTASLVPLSPTAQVLPRKPAAPPQPEPTGTVQMRSFAEASAASLPQMFFELGKFKDEVRARDLGDRVAQLGLRPSVVQKGHLWMSAFYVLVGPYRDQEEATRTHRNLLSHGYQPRPFERGSRSFAFTSGLTLAGTKLPVGDFTINWESYVTDAKVKFEQGNYVMATANGQWVQRPARYKRDEYMYFKANNGLRLLREIHFSGLDRALVFRDAS